MATLDQYKDNKYWCLMKYLKYFCIDMNSGAQGAPHPEVMLAEKT